MNRRPTRAVTLATAALTVGALVLSGCSKESTDADRPDGPGERNAAAVRAADWLLGERGEKGLLTSTTSYEETVTTADDPGASADLVLALSALGHADDEAAAVTDALAAAIESYVGADEEVYSGPSAKALTVALDQGRDPKSFGGLDLLARVESTVATEGATRGRISDSSEYGDYANVIGQAYAAGALTRAESDLADPALNFLLDQQCEAGFFRLYLSEPDAKDQTCDGAGDLGEQSPDVTAFVVLQLAPVVSAGNPKIAEALDAAGDWLEDQQAEDGSFADPDNGVNVNSTGLAGWALRVLGEDEEADAASDWLRTLQVPEDATGNLADEVGALAYDAEALTTGEEHGIADPLDRTQWVQAGVQAAPALAGELEGGDRR